MACPSHRFNVALSLGRTAHRHKLSSYLKVWLRFLFSGFLRSLFALLLALSAAYSIMLSVRLLSLFFFVSFGSLVCVIRTCALTSWPDTTHPGLKSIIFFFFSLSVLSCHTERDFKGNTITLALDFKEGLPHVYVCARGAHMLSLLTLAEMGQIKVIARCVWVYVSLFFPESS